MCNSNVFRFSRDVADDDIDEALKSTGPLMAQTFLVRVHFYLVVFGGLYLLLVLLLAVPFLQSHVIYLNSIRLPLFANFNTPEKYGLAPNKTLNLKIRTSDNETIGAWFILSDSYYRSLPAVPFDVAVHVTKALKKRPTILFFHGNAATRAFHARILHYQALSSRLAANVLAIDYRGFADSTGSPSEEGLTRDARAAWDWLVHNGAEPEDILIVGHSLGTGVSMQLGVELSLHKIQCRGIVLLSPFSSIREVLNTYHMFGFIPLIKPLAIIPGAIRFVEGALIHKFDSLQAVPNITSSVLIGHAENDWDIPDSHSDVLFEAFLDIHLPPVSPPDHATVMTTDQWNTFTTQQAARQNKRNELVTTTVMANFGRVDAFEADGRKLVLVKTLFGGHDYLGVQEGIQDVIGRTFGL